MVEIDGSDGGGQIVRTALALSMCTGEPVELSGIRGNRSESGLGAQHLTAVETAAEICDATVDGAELGATEITFDPGEPTGGHYEAAIGTAGSVTLLFDTVLPVATRISEPLVLTATGGTDVKWSPPMAYYRRVKLPVVRRSGFGAVVERDRTGFYPAGGGRATLRLWPSDPVRLEYTEVEPEPETVEAAVYSTAAASLADAEVAERQATAAVSGLDELGIETTTRKLTSVETRNPGSAVVIRIAESEETTGTTDFFAGFDAFGEQGKPAENVAADAVDEAQGFLQTTGAVDEQLADQVLVLLALAGGRVAIPTVTDHVETSLDVFDAFGYEFRLDRSGSTPVVIADGPG